MGSFLILYGLSFALRRLLSRSCGAVAQVCAWIWRLNHILEDSYAMRRAYLHGFTILRVVELLESFTMVLELF